MVVVPDTEIRLLKCPISLDNKNQLNFNNQSSQYNYFNSLPHITLENATYLRKDGYIRFNNEDNLHYEQLLQYNYVMYKNSNYSDKWFFAFITSMVYQNDNLTDIYIETDVFQTWLFDWLFHYSFIEREMVNVEDDLIGKNTVPENLELGEYITYKSWRHNPLEDLCYVMQVTEYLNGVKPLATNYGGIWQAGGAYVTDDIRILQNLIEGYNNSTTVTADAIQTIYTIPKAIINYPTESSQYSGQEAPFEYTFSFPKITSFDNYSPINKKLLTYPYNFLVMSNNNGVSNILINEDFDNYTEFTFKIKGIPVIGGSIKCVPTNYKHVDYNEEEGILCGKFPTTNWSKDEYLNWMKQNAVNLGIGITSSSLNLVSGLSMSLLPNGQVFGISNTINSAVSIANQIGQIYQHSLIPNSSQGSVNGADINTASKTNTFYFYQKAIKPEYAKIIDDYFNMYGYKTNRVKLPNLNNRPNWNYIKTINCIITGNIPDKDILQLRKLFDDGITIWHNPQTFLDYSKSNR